MALLVAKGGLIVDQIKIGSFLKELRKEKGLTQEQLAEQLNTSNRTISRWETGNNMPDLSMIITLAEYYDVEVREILDGERKSENMNEEMKYTLKNVVNYTEMQNAKSMRAGILTMSAVFAVLVLICVVKGIAPAPLVSMLCAYNGATFVSKAKKDKHNLVIGCMFFGGMFVNTIAFIFM